MFATLNRVWIDFKAVIKTSYPGFDCILNQNYFFFTKSRKISNKYLKALSAPGEGGCAAGCAGGCACGNNGLVEAGAEDA